MEQLIGVTVGVWTIYVALRLTRPPARRRTDGTVAWLRKVNRDG